MPEDALSAGQPPHPSHAAQQHCDNRAILYQPRHQLRRRGAPRSSQKGQVIAVHLTTRKPRKPPSIPRHGVSMVSPEVTFSPVFTAFAASHGVTMVSSWRFSVDPPGRETKKGLRAMLLRGLFFRWFTAFRRKEAPAGFEPAMADLQSAALATWPRRPNHHRLPRA